MVLVLIIYFYQSLYLRKEDLESHDKSGSEEESGENSEEEEREEKEVGEGEAETNGEKTAKVSKHHSSGSKHKKKKHKHRSKHKKHKHPSEEDKDRKRKHRHKHKKHKRKDGSSSSVPGINSASSQRKTHISPSSDDKALLEELEKQRAMIKAELDSQVMEGGKVQSGMGLILQGYNSGSEEGDGEGRVRNGEQRQKGSMGKPPSPRGRSGKARRDSTEASKSRQGIQVGQNNQRQQRCSRQRPWPQQIKREEAFPKRGQVQREKQEVSFPLQQEGRAEERPLRQTLFAPA
jgi:serine/threonine-protein kinase PRP4